MNAAHHNLPQDPLHYVKWIDIGTSVDNGKAVNSCTLMGSRRDFLASPATANASDKTNVTCSAGAAKLTTGKKLSLYKQFKSRTHKTVDGSFTCFGIYLESNALAIHSQM